MVVGDRLRELWETQKKLSQGDIDKRTGPLRCSIYIQKINTTISILGSLRTAKNHQNRGPTFGGTNENATGTFDRAGFLSIFAA